ncbi:unnamed protein product [Brassicogethes aeneus]|uniref:Geranylgeranyl transferase type-2 subunit alpha n=1 Tax=Brassicogethes aeneus TaxID=1431903 RepID=A0A9P0B3I2_BRAAE|nr:unnamed protein product [Brassicogethes aeneus]
MHGRLKVKTTEEQRIEKHKQQQKKLAAYRMGMKQILSTRSIDSYEPESLAICTQILSGNPDIYTLWNIRKEIILIEIEKSKSNDIEGEDQLTKFLDNEIGLTETCLKSNPKSYGAWHHRYWVLLHHPNPNWTREFNLISMYLSYDDRNFHVWDYRRLILQKKGETLENEIKFSTNLLNENFSNYSSWHYRSTLRKLDADTVGNELTLVQNAVFTDPADSSAWFYLRWVLSHPNIPCGDKEEALESFEQLQELEPECKWVLLAKCWLTGSLCLNDKKHVDKRVEYYQQLIKLDPQRKGQYEDYLKAAETKKAVGDN